MVRAKQILPVRSDLSHRLEPRHDAQRFVPRPRILIVEDDRDIREVLAESISDLGFDVLQAHDGISGLAHAERDAPDLVLLDLMLPQRSGMFVLGQLKARRIRRIPVIMMSGSRDARHQELAAAQGADAFLLKPFEHTQFLELMQALLPNWGSTVHIRIGTVACQTSLF